MRMNQRLAAFACVLALLVALLPSAVAETKYGMTTAKGVRVRIEPSTDALYWFQVEKGYVCEITGQTTKSKITWYEVNVVDPDPQNGGKVYSGYIHGDYFTPLTKKQTKAWLANPVQPFGAQDEMAQAAVNEEESAPVPEATEVPVTEAPATEAPAAEQPAENTPEPRQPATEAPDVVGEPGAAEPEVTAAPALPKDDATAEPGATGRITNGGVNFRETPGGRSMAKLDRNVVVELLTIPAVVDSEHWFKVRYNGLEGYIQAPFIQVLTTGGLPTTTDAVSQYGYAQLKLSSANLRMTPAGAVGAQWERTGEIIPIVGPSVAAANYTWYPVNFGGKTYYVREDCINVLDSDGTGTAPVTAAPATPTPTPVPGTYGYVTTTKTNVNLRLQPAGEFIRVIAKKGTVLTCLGPSTNSKGYLWYYVQDGALRGYVRGDCVKVTDANGQDPTPTPAPVTPTPDPNATAAPATEAPATAAPTAAPTAAAYGSVRITKSGVNLRVKPAGESIEQLKKNVIATVTGPSVNSGNYIWYPVLSPATGRAGYVRGDCCEPVNTATATPAPEGQETPAPTANPYGYVKTTKSNVNLRKSPAGESIARVPENEVLPLTGKASQVQGYAWYPVQYGRTAGYLRGDCVAACDANGNVDTSPTAAPVESVNAVITIVDKVNLRASASKDAKAKYNVAIGTVAVYTSVRTVGGTKWYQIIYNNENVWVLGSCVREMTSEEYEAYIAANPTSTPQTNITLGYVKTTKNGINVRSEAAGSNIVGRINKGLVLPYTEQPVVKGKYTWYKIKTDEVEGWIRSDCLSVTDENGNPTPVPTNNPINTDTDSPSMVLYPAEKIDWYTGGIQTLWPKGSNNKIYDVRTGIVWWCHRWSGGSHVDGEPLTAADTARLCRIYGVSKASEIASKNMWQRRPCLVTIGNRTFACSLYGVPHNQAGDTIASNNYSGQLCLHFTNSRIHSSNKVDSLHQEAIQYAWEHAPNGHMD